MCFVVTERLQNQTGQKLPSTVLGVEVESKGSWRLGITSQIKIFKLKEVKITGIKADTLCSPLAVIHVHHNMHLCMNTHTHTISR